MIREIKRDDYTMLDIVDKINEIIEKLNDIIEK
jgi:hypothetical protein